MKAFNGQFLFLEQNRSFYPEQKKYEPFWCMCGVSA